MENMEIIINEINAAMEIIAKKHDLSYRRGNVRYNDNEIKFNGLKFNSVGENGVNPQDELNFKLHSIFYGIKEGSFGKLFKINGKDHKISGFNSRASKNKINIEDMSGNKFKCSVELLKQKAPQFFS